MVTQRRYSVTGQTPPDDAEAMKARSPKLQALDTSVTTTSCGLCEGAAETSRLGPAAIEGSGAEQLRGRKMTQAGTVVRTSSKRSATQLPSPNSPSHELPPKIARYRLGHADHVDMHVPVDMDMDMDMDADSHVLRERGEQEEQRMGSGGQTTSAPSSPEYSQPSSVFGMPDAASLEQLQLCTDEGPEDDCMEHLALSPPHSRKHSLGHILFDEKHQLQQNWAAFQNAALLQPEPEAIGLEPVETPPTVNGQDPLTLLTLPPEIRHQIYRKCDNLILDKPLVYCISTFDGEMQHPLASVSRQVRSEALAIFYSYNTWVIKVEFRMMYEAFRDWIIRLGDGAGLLRLISFSVRGSLFKPKRTHTQNVMFHGQLVQIPPGGAAGTASREELYCPPDGDASFKIDLSEKFIGGKVMLVRNDGTKEAGEKARVYLEKLVAGLWEKRRAGTLNGQDWVTMVDKFVAFIARWS
ncbi:Nn.00g114140.m01.CDS01 [Neocucurbitaria sp. VM-36]